MCLQDLWIGQYIAHNYRRVLCPNGSVVQVAPANPRRIAITFTTRSQTPVVAPENLPDTNVGFPLTDQLSPPKFELWQWGSLVTTAWFGSDTGEGAYIGVIEAFLTLPLEEILARYNQEFRKANGIDSWVPNLPLPPTITPNLSQPSKRY